MAKRIVGAFLILATLLIFRDDIRAAFQSEAAPTQEAPAQQAPINIYLNDPTAQAELSEDALTEDGQLNLSMASEADLQKVQDRVTDLKVHFDTFYLVVHEMGAGDLEITEQSVQFPIFRGNVTLPGTTQTVPVLVNGILIGGIDLADMLGSAEFDEFFIDVEVPAQNGDQQVMIKTQKSVLVVNLRARACFGGFKLYKDVWDPNYQGQRSIDAATQGPFFFVDDISNLYRWVLPDKFNSVYPDYDAARQAVDGIYTATQRIVADNKSELYAETYNAVTNDKKTGYITFLTFFQLLADFGGYDEAQVNITPAAGWPYPDVECPSTPVEPGTFIGSLNSLP